MTTGLRLRLSSGLLSAAVLASSLAFCLPSSAAPPAPLRFAAEDWAPFVTNSLPGQGLSASFVDAVLARAGYTARIDYFPWKRTVEIGLHHPGYAGFLAVWRTPEREKLCHFSSSIGSTRNVLAYLKDAPVQAASLADLQGMRIGTVAGYSNGEQFDGMARAGKLRAEEGVNDETNLRKLLTGRYPAIVIEKRVLRHLLARGPFSRTERERIVFSEQLFKERSVHVCFKRNEEGLKLQRAFNEAAREFDLGNVEREYWRRMGDEVALLPMQ
ncbi:substrate-binding periplasmic protein [Pseudoduganella aquatica]|uniref:Transporter substrate-binding domain-containing protein n=1 Tax=Pseudoduganella aquatica TaxID=2660641 RepID=A0A7X4HBK4_9BURK|nr:transporter substrate-binding domain-containing protein [Pseudoduganella aquatica]MYN08160.1 transporter substrate-binding domain-containing protein [Pseudoduganella aquatica]